MPAASSSRAAASDYRNCNSNKLYGGVQARPNGPVQARSCRADVGLALHRGAGAQARTSGTWRAVRCWPDVKRRAASTGRLRRETVSRAFSSGLMSRGQYQVSGRLRLERGCGIDAIAALGSPGDSLAGGFESGPARRGRRSGLLGGGRYRGRRRSGSTWYRRDSGLADPLAGRDRAAVSRPGAVRASGEPGRRSGSHVGPSFDAGRTSSGGRHSRAGLTRAIRIAGGIELPGSFAGRQSGRRSGSTRKAAGEYSTMRRGSRARRGRYRGPGRLTAGGLDVERAGSSLRAASPGDSLAGGFESGPARRGRGSGLRGTEGGAAQAGAQARMWRAVRCRSAPTLRRESPEG